MQNRHMTEIRDLLSKKRLSKSRFNPESRVDMATPSLKQSRDLQKSKSSASSHIEKQKQLDIQIIEKRYQELQNEYENLVGEARKRAEMCKRQEEEIDKYEKAGERDMKQIERLTCMVGMVQKQNVSVQTTEDENNQKKQYKFVEQLTESKKPSKLKDCESQQKLSVFDNKNTHIESENDENSKFTILNSKGQCGMVLKNSREKYAKNFSVSKKGIGNEKDLMKRFESSKVNESVKMGEFSKMTESLLYGNKSSIDFRKKKAQVERTDQNIDNAEQTRNERVYLADPALSMSNPPPLRPISRVIVSKQRVNSPNVRVNSPNSRFKFVPSVDI